MSAPHLRVTYVGKSSEVYESGSLSGRESVCSYLRSALSSIYTSPSRHSSTNIRRFGRPQAH